MMNTHAPSYYGHIDYNFEESKHLHTAKQYGNSHIAKRHVTFWIIPKMDLKPFKL